MTEQKKRQNTPKKAPRRKSTEERRRLYVKIAKSAMARQGEGE